MCLFLNAVLLSFITFYISQSNMKKHIGVMLIGLLTVLVFSNFMTINDWFVLEAKQYGYKIEFPEKPTEKPQRLNSTIGELKLNMFIHDASKGGKDDNLMYMVNCTEYPDSTVNSEKIENIDVFYRGAIDGAVKNVHGKLLSEMKIELDKHEGREIKVDFKDGLAVIRMRMFLVKNRVYMIQTITETSKDFNKSTTRFMDSFRFIPIENSHKD
jgi:hypothetical protein